MKRKLRALYRLRLIKADAQRYYDAMTYHCAKLSALNREMAFAVYHVGIFGGPKVEQIRRPENVVLSESAKCSIVKDGCIYSLKKAASTVLKKRYGYA